MVWVRLCAKVADANDSRGILSICDPFARVCVLVCVVPTLHQALATNPSALEEVRALLGASSEDLQLAVTQCLAELSTHLSSTIEAAATMGPSRCVSVRGVRKIYVCDSLYDRALVLLCRVP